MAVILSKAVGGNLFHWQGNHGSAEMSTLTGSSTCFGRVYDDAIDEGVIVIGNHDRVYFVIDHIDQDIEEIYGWNLVSINPKTGRPDGKYTLLIIND